MSFAADLSKFAERTDTKMDSLVRNVMLGISNSVIEMSPVGNPDIWLYKDPKDGTYKDFLAYRNPPDGYVGGRFRANWQLNTNSIDRSTTDATDKNGSATKNKLAAAIATITAGNIHYLSNNLPYSIRLEYGWSTQAPAGMVRQTTSRFRRLIKKAVKDVQ